MKKLLSILLMAFLIVSCKGQQYPLNTFFENVPQGAYLKDLNHELDPYVGIYKTNFEGNEITLHITKQENKLEKSTGKTYYMDALIIKYIVKNSLGVTLQDTQNQTVQTNKLYSINTRPYENSVILYYTGTNCGVGWGKVTLKKLNSIQISWDYSPNSTSVGDDCPANADKTVYLPETDNLIFTKQ
ncbi:DUF6705 family protein [Chryseobacterium sp. C3]|uniref:DUF6705 family protein n=1 Tax=Chryseobacterium sp. C3 TaxID=2761532 RepID=UPI00162A1A52|nr:DUF6705 family protein [Chryseobacterium sp. C3]